MEKSFQKMLNGYQQFRKKYAVGDTSAMHQLSTLGQHPEFMVLACCDSRVDPAVLLQCDPGEIFTMRNIANIIPPYQKDNTQHDTCAALEYAIRVLKVKHLIILGHSQCGGIQAALSVQSSHPNDFIANWIALIKPNASDPQQPDTYAKVALLKSLERCASFEWMRKAVENRELTIHAWFFEIESGQIFTYKEDKRQFAPFAE